MSKTVNRFLSKIISKNTAKKVNKKLNSVNQRLKKVEKYTSRENWVSVQTVLVPVAEVSKYTTPVTSVLKKTGQTVSPFEKPVTDFIVSPAKKLINEIYWGKERSVMKAFSTAASEKILNRVLSVLEISEQTNFISMLVKAGKLVEFIEISGKLVQLADCVNENAIKYNSYVAKANQQVNKIIDLQNQSVRQVEFENLNQITDYQSIIEETELWEKEFKEASKAAPTLKIRNSNWFSGWFTSKEEDLCNNLAEAMKDAEYKLIEEKSEEWIDDIDWEETRNWSEPQLKGSRILKAMKNTYDKLNLASNFLQEIEKYASATEKDFILRKTVPVVLKRIVSPALRKIGYGAESLADYFDEVTAKEKDFKKFLSQIKMLSTSFNKHALKAKKLTGSLIDKLEQSSRQGEFEFMKNNSHLYSANLSSKADSDDEEMVLLSNQDEEKTQTIPGAFPKNEDTKEDEEIFYDAVEYQSDEQKDEEEFEIISSAPQQEALIEVKTKTSLLPAKKIKGLSSLFFPFKFK